MTQEVPRRDSVLETAQTMQSRDRDTWSSSHIADLWGVLDALPDGVTIYTPIYGESSEIVDFQFLYANQQSAKLLKTGTEDLRGASLCESFPGIRESGLFNFYVRVYRSGKSAVTDYFYAYDDLQGWYRIYLVKTSMGLVKVFQDISEEKQVEHRWKDQHARALTLARMASIGEMTAHLAHEINTPLTIISARVRQLTELIQQNAFSTHEALNMAAEVENMIDRASLALSSLQQIAQTGERPDHFCLQELAQTCLGLCRGKFIKHGIELRLKVLSESLPVLGHRAETAQVILNLLNNAIDATSSQAMGKWVEIRVDRSEDLQGRIRITDSGTKITPDVQKRLFEPFFSTKELRFGTGIGLSASRSIIESQGGKIWFDSESIYTSFVFTIPLYGENSGENER